jgi:glutamate/tyrosine decarboxylase-like PLP-dependent enzyme
MMTMLKALRLLGFGTAQVHFVPTDEQGRMMPSKMPHQTGPLIVCAQAGNVNTGACDPLNEICDAAREMNAWVHVDGAFGLWAATSSSRKHLVDGISRADSWATDAHKWLNVPQDSGICFVRDAASLQRAMAITASYYPEPAPHREPMQWGPESSRRARAVEIWAALRSLGYAGVEQLIERTCVHAAKFEAGFLTAGFEVLNQVVLNQVLVSFGDDETTSRVIHDVQAEGTCWCGGTVWKGRRAMRISVSSWATTQLDVERSLAAILAIAESLQRQRSGHL